MKIWVDPWRLPQGVGGALHAHETQRWLARAIGVAELHTIRNSHIAPLNGQLAQLQSKAS